MINKLLRNVIESNSKDELIVSFFADKVSEILSDIDYSKMQMDAILQNENDAVECVLDCVEYRQSEDTDSLDRALEGFRELERFDAITLEKFHEINDFFKIG